MSNSNLKDAIKEAYASAPADKVILHTIELEHQNFVDDQGNSTNLRVVRDYQNLVCRLGDDETEGDAVEFLAFPFQITLPPVTEKSAPYALLSIDNVSREIARNIDLALTSQSPIKVVYRPFVVQDKDYKLPANMVLSDVIDTLDAVSLPIPQYNTPLRMVLTDVTADIFKVKAKATFPNFANRTFPSVLYTSDRFPSLAV